MRKHEPEIKEKESQSHDSLGKKEGKARRKTRRRIIGQSSFTNSTDVTSGRSTIDTAFTSEKSIDRPHSTHCHSSTGSTSTSQHDRDCASMLDRQEIDNTTSISTNSISSVDTHQCHTTSSMTDPEGIEDDIRVLMNHSLPKSPQRTNVITADYTPRRRPRGRLFGAFTQRGLGITHASCRYPDVFNAIHNIAQTRPGDFTIDPYMSAQLNEAMSLPVHKDSQFVHDLAHCFRRFYWWEALAWISCWISSTSCSANCVGEKPSRRIPWCQEHLGLCRSTALPCSRANHFRFTTVLSSFYA